MTTIAYDHANRTVAIDSRVCQGDFISRDDAEKFIPDGDDMYFMSGSIGDFKEFIERASGRISGAIENSIECTGLLVSNGEAFVCVLRDDGKVIKEHLDYDETIGSGSVLAIAAMDFGRSAKESIEYAKTRDASTGGKVRVFDISIMEFIE